MHGLCQRPDLRDRILVISSERLHYVFAKSRSTGKGAAREFAPRAKVTSLSFSS